jgi:hypothetical protein
VPPSWRLARWITLPDCTGLRNDAKPNRAGLTFSLVRVAVRVNTNRMDDVDRLFALFEDSGGAIAWKLDSLLDLGQHHDARVTAFLLRVLSDPAEPPEVRVAIIRLVRNRHLASAEHCEAARALVDVLASVLPGGVELRTQAALALGDLIDVDEVLAVLGDRAADVQDDFDVRYAAFTSLERAGPLTESIAILTRLRTDETFGRSAESILARWRVEG